MKRKIAFHLNCLEQGGAERVVSNLANRFAREGYDVFLATEWYGENEFQIEKEVRRVHVGLMASPGTKVPVLISIRTDPAGHYDALSDKIQIPLLFPRAAGCVFQTEGQREFFAPYLQKNSKIILNPIHDKYIGVPEPEKRKKEVVQSGRLVDFKNQPMLLQAFLQVHKKHPDYVLKIYGGDSFDGTKEILESIIEKNGAGDYIQLMGASDCLEKDLTDAAVYAFSSDWEGLPNALLEAMALGLPIVATDCPCGGPRTVMADGVNGLLVPIKDPKAMEEGINRLIEHPKLGQELGRNARKIKDIANSTAVFEQWRDYIEEICMKGSAGKKRGNGKKDVFI